MELTIHVENHYNFDDDMLNNGGLDTLMYL